MNMFLKAGGREYALADVANKRVTEQLSGRILGDSKRRSHVPYKGHDRTRTPAIEL